jgi:hypothetical protein
LYFTFIRLFLSILTLENEALRSFEMSVTTHLSTETHIQEVTNPQKHRCENLKWTKCDTAVRKERKQQVARHINISKCVLTLIREKHSGLKWLGVAEVLVVGSWITWQLGACQQLVCGTACSDIQGSYFIWQVAFVLPLPCCMWVLSAEWTRWNDMDGQTGSGGRLLSLNLYRIGIWCSLRACGTKFSFDGPLNLLCIWQ